MRPSFASQTLHTLILGVLTGHQNMRHAVDSVMWSLVTIEIVVVAIWTAFGEEQIASLLKKLLGLGIWIWIVQSFPRLAQAFVESVATVALRAGGKGDDFSVLLDPSSIMVRGLQTTAPFLQALNAVPWTNVADKITYSICYIAIVWMYIWMAWCCFYPVLEYYIFVALGSILMPFAVSRHTRFIADKAIHMVLACGIKLMVLAFLLALIQPVLDTVKFQNTNHIEWNELFSVMFVIGGLGYTLWKAPTAAMSFVQGSPSLQGGDVLVGLGRIGFNVVTWAPMTAARHLVGNAVNSGLGGAQRGGPPGGTGGTGP